MLEIWNTIAANLATYFSQLLPDKQMSYRNKFTNILASRTRVLVRNSNDA
jgi:hypothetical protein